jgi:hypothetical protein
MITTSSLFPHCLRARRRPLLFLANLVIYEGYQAAAYPINFSRILTACLFSLFPLFHPSLPVLPVALSFSRSVRFFN